MTDCRRPAGGHLTERLLDDWWTGEVDSFTVFGEVLTHLDERCPACRRGLRGPDGRAVEALKQAERRLIWAHMRRGLSARGDVPT